MPGFENRQEQKKAKRLESQPRLNSGGCSSPACLHQHRASILLVALLLVPLAVTAATEMNSPLYFFASLTPDSDLRLVQVTGRA